MIKQWLFWFLLGVSVSAQAEIISDWNLIGATGNEAFIEANTTASNVTGMRLRRGAGIVPNNAANTFNARDWDDATADEYYGFGFEVGAGFAVNLSSLTITLRASNKGPDDLGLFYSADNFGASLFVFDQPGTNDNTQIIDLTALQGLTGSHEFRIMALNNDSADGGTITAGGTLRIANTLAFNGAVQAVPEPNTYAMLAFGLLLILLHVYRNALRARENPSLKHTISKGVLFY